MGLTRCAHRFPALPGVRTVGDAELDEDAGYVVPDGLLGQAQAGCDRAVARPGRHQFQDLPFSRIFCNPGVAWPDHNDLRLWGCLRASTVRTRLAGVSRRAGT